MLTYFAKKLGYVKREKVQVPHRHMYWNWNRNLIKIHTIINIYWTYQGLLVHFLQIQLIIMTQKNKRRVN